MLMRISLLLCLSLVLSFVEPASSYAAKPKTTTSRTKKKKVADEAPASKGPISTDYARMFEYARELLPRPEVKKFLKQVFKDELVISEELQQKYHFPEKETEMAENQFILLLQENPRLWKLLDQYVQEIDSGKEGTAKQEARHKEWRAKFKEVIDDSMLERFKKHNDPTEAVPLVTADGSPAYSNLKLHVDHKRVQDGNTIPPEDLRQIWVDFINGATKEWAMNVYDFDLQVLADAMIAKAKEGIPGRVGIDAKVIEARPEVKAIFEQLKATKNIQAFAVDAVGLNHQKIVTRDWSIPEKASVLLSSGNATQSCVGPEGDMVAFDNRPKESVPNANHMITMDSYVMANLLNHELTKVLDMGLRGNGFPLAGSYRLPGPVKNGKPTSIVITFSPHGAIGNVNNDLIAKLITDSRGPIRMLQFAFSSKGVEDALLERAQADVAAGHEFDFQSVGDTPFAMRDWSTFLSMSGYGLEVDGKSHKYYELKDSPWVKALGKNGIAKLREGIRVAPPYYGTHHWADPSGQDHEVTSKIHHKVLVVPGVEPDHSDGAAILGTSHNFSENALHNNEQLMIIYDGEIAQQAMGMFEGLRVESKRSVVETAERRNSFAGDSDDGAKELQLKPDARAKTIEASVVGRSKAARARKIDDPKSCVEELSAR
ncbi:MAG: hypothetical protein HY075_13260 [Deltaproteobacteria bacterium]|nr:hypothetical protein [Deltaproteobacteria bacterium]